MSRTGSTPDPLAGWPTFTRQVRERLDRGQCEYHDESFSWYPTELVELQEEALDGAGWGFVLWHRIQAIRSTLRDDPRP